MLGDGYMVQASEIFYGFCRYFSSLGLSYKIGWSTWAQRSLWYFDALGRMLGYDVWMEDTLTDTEGWKCPSKLRGKRVDMVWVIPGELEYVLALEHQGSPKYVDTDIEKLAVYPKLKVLIIYGSRNKDRILSKIRKELDKREKEKGSLFLLISVPNQFNVEPPFMKLEALLLNDSGDVLGEGSAEAHREKSTDLCFFTKTNWITNV